MKLSAALFAASMLAATACSTRDRAPGRPPANSPFSLLYAKNCAGCHGLDGKGGAALGLADPVYLAIADDATIRRITATGVPGTAMPAFAQQSGGMLTDEQINDIVRGIRAGWASPNALAVANPPPYAAQASGDPKRGEAAYAVYCSSCHGASGRGGGRAGAIVDRSYLALISDQGLRTHVIVGRPDLGAPDWRGDVPGKPMSPEDISDVVAWLAAQRQLKGGSQ
ncbi:MAG: cytochrome c, class [Candidatus Solibacter sp.]|jgi:cytochrome c oxidase cbb3-type subunit 3|nr:cytochrome c, class [Candidatus Solibacter sp.]